MNISRYPSQLAFSRQRSRGQLGKMPIRKLPTPGGLIDKVGTMSRDNNDMTGGNNIQGRDRRSIRSRLVVSGKRQHPTLPDFDTLKDMARHRPDELEALRIALCNKVIDEAPDHAKHRLRGLMFQINARRQLAGSDLEACEDISSMMHDSLQRMQAMLKDLRSIQSESIMLSTRHHRETTAPESSATIIPFRQGDN